MQTKYQIIFMLILILSASDRAVCGLVNNSAHIVVSGSTYLVVDGNYTSQGSGAASGSGVVNLTGNLVNNNSSGNPVSTTGTVSFAGSSQQQISGNSIAFGNVTLSNSNGLVMGCDASVGDTLTLTTGNLDLNDQDIVLDADATLAETGGRVLGTGSISTIRTLDNITSINIAGLGAEITTVANMGSTIITRTHAAQTGNGNQSILRTYDISPTNNSELNATLVFHYDDSELNGLDEPTLILYRSEDGGSTWQPVGGTVNIAENTITLSNIDQFSRWTAGGTGDKALPVELSSFNVQNSPSGIKLNWTTATEVDNLGFILERSRKPNSEFEQVASYQSSVNLQGQGTVSVETHYEYMDYDSFQPGQTYYYRLSDVDMSGKKSVLETKSITLPQAYSLSQNYPNPFNPTTTINFTMKKAGTASLKVYDVLGRLVFQKSIEAKYGSNSYNFDGTNLTSGIYFYQLNTENFSKTLKMMLVK